MARMAPAAANDPGGFRDTLDGLANGDFSRLEPVFVGGDSSSGSQILRWYEQGLFEDRAEALAEALTCACFLGVNDAAEFLLAEGVDPAGGAGTGLNALHWAANRGQLEAVRLLIRSKAPLEAKNRYGGNALDTAIWSAIHEPRPDHDCIIEELLEAGARPRAGRQPTGRHQVDGLLRRYDVFK